MKLNFYFTSVLIIAVCLLCLVVLHLQNKGEQAGAVKIAILVPAAHPSLKKIEQGFTTTFSELFHSPVEYKVYNAHGDRALLGTLARTITEAAYSAAITIGAQASLIMKEQLQKRNRSMPLIFAAVDDPVGLNLVKSLTMPAAGISGVYEQPHYQKALKALIALKPAAKKILLVYNPTQGAGLEKQKDDLELTAQQHRITLQACAVFSAQEIIPKAGAFAGDVDAIMILKDNTVVPAVNSLIKLCRQNHIPLVTNDLESGTQGAVLSVGVNEEAFGQHAAHIASALLAEPGQSVACTNAGDALIVVNYQTAPEQGITLSKEIIEKILNNERK